MLKYNKIITSVNNNCSYYYHYHYYNIVVIMITINVIVMQYTLNVTEHFDNAFKVFLIDILSQASVLTPSQSYECRQWMTREQTAPYPVTQPLVLGW